MAKHPEGPAQQALFDIDGPDEDGCVWICSPKGEEDVWCRNLGPRDKVAERLWAWFSANDIEERY